MAVPTFATGRLTENEIEFGWKMCDGTACPGLRGICPGIPHAHHQPITVERCTKPRCTNLGTGFECVCLNCSKVYRCCESHGGEKAARRSLKSHMGLYHPKKASE